MRSWLRRKNHVSIPLSGERRRLRLQKGGAWYVALTLLLGVSAVNSGNNLLYLIESFLLGGMILSGILSEWAIRSLEIDWVPISRRAGIGPPDRIRIHNHSRLPFFCLRIREWKVAPDANDPVLFIAHLPKRATRVYTLPRPELKRGKYVQRGLSISTRFPFGWAEKTRIIFQHREFYVWPGAASGAIHDPSDGQFFRPLSTSERVPGEIRALLPHEDHRDQLWMRHPLKGDAIAPVRGQTDRTRNFTLDCNRLESEAPHAREDVLARISDLICENEARPRDPQFSLKIRGPGDTTRTLRGSTESLNALSLIFPESAG